MGAADEDSAGTVVPDLEGIRQRIRMALLLTGGIVVSLTLVGTASPSTAPSWPGW